MLRQSVFLKKSQAKRIRRERDVHRRMKTKRVLNVELRSLAFIL